LVLFDFAKPEKCRPNMVNPMLRQPPNRSQTAAQKSELLFQQSLFGQQVCAFNRHPLPESRNIKGIMPADLPLAFLDCRPDSLKFQLNSPPNRFIIDDQQRPAPILSE
jgi:hypothetical protein